MLNLLLICGRGQVLRTSSRNNTEFFRRMSSLQDLKTKRSHLKEAIQNVKASAHADKQSRQGQMNCVRWMNRTHRRLATNINSIHAQHAAMSKAELVEKLQLVENAIQDMTKEQFLAAQRSNEKYAQSENAACGRNQIAAGCRSSCRSAQLSMQNAA